MSREPSRLSDQSLAESHDPAARGTSTRSSWALRHSAVVPGGWKGNPSAKEPASASIRSYRASSTELSAIGLIGSHLAAQSVQTTGPLNSFGEACGFAGGSQFHSGVSWRKVRAAAPQTAPLCPFHRQRPDRRQGADRASQAELLGGLSSSSNIARASLSWSRLQAAPARRNRH